MPHYAGSSHSFGSGGRSLGPPSRPSPWGHSSSNVALPLDKLNDRRPSASPRPSAPSAAVDVSDSKPVERPAVAPPPQKPPPAAADSVKAQNAHDYRDAFRAARSSTAKPDTGNPPRFRAAVEAERWRARLAGDDNKKGKDDKLDSYRQPQQSEWARERLLGTERKSDDDREEEEHDVRSSRAVGQAWRASATEWVEVVAINRLEDTLRKRLGELESSSANAGKVARQFFLECDPQRQGRIFISHFIEAMGRKLNYDFPPRGDTPGSRSVIEALFRRYDVERSGVVHCDDFHAALVGASRPGRASGRVVNAIGRLREGLVRNAGGYDALRAADARWFKASEDGGLPKGCLTAGAFVDELMELSLIAEAPLTEADLCTLLDTFEPPPDAYKDESEKAKQALRDATDPLVSFDEFTLALRGPSMGSSRVQITRAAYAALKEDAKVGVKTMVKPAHLADRYDTSRHPAVARGTMEEEEAAMAFLKVVLDEHKDTLDQEVNVKEFCDRYEWISPLYDGLDGDERFEEMMKAAWRLK